MCGYLAGRSWYWISTAAALEQKSVKLFTLNALPLGGFVRLHGRKTPVKANYPSVIFPITPAAKALVAVAGALYDLIFAV